MIFQEQLTRKCPLANLAPKQLLSSLYAGHDAGALGSGVRVRVAPSCVQPPWLHPPLLPAQPAFPRTLARDVLAVEAQFSMVGGDFCWRDRPNQIKRAFIGAAFLCQ